LKEIWDHGLKDLGIDIINREVFLFNPSIPQFAIPEFDFPQ
jgi:hypothetical protein